jgi:osmotically inducible lipoprotein OsmB
MKISLPLVSATLLVAMTFSSCETPGQSAVAGAATGAAIGGLLHGRGSDALAGAAIGAGAGYLLGKVAQEDRRARYYDGYDARVVEVHHHGRYPLGEMTNRYGFVRSPYRPFSLIDVRGIPRGAKVVDPSTDRIFINP